MTPNRRKEPLILFGEEPLTLFGEFARHGLKVFPEGRFGCVLREGKDGRQNDTKWEIARRGPKVFPEGRFG